MKNDQELVAIPGIRKFLLSGLRIYISCPIRSISNFVELSAIKHSLNSDLKRIIILPQGVGSRALNCKN